MATELELFSTEDLMAELYSRYDCVVFAGLRDLSSADQETDCGFAGGAITARGLAEDLIDYIRVHQKGRPERDGLTDWDAEDA